MSSWQKRPWNDVSYMPRFPRWSYNKSLDLLYSLPSDKDTYESLTKLQTLKCTLTLLGALVVGVPFVLWVLMAERR